MNQQEIELSYMHLKDAVKKMLAAQKEYFSTKDKQKLIIAKSYEKKVLDMINPPATKEKTLFDLAQ